MNYIIFYTFVLYRLKLLKKSKKLQYLFWLSLNPETYIYNKTTYTEIKQKKDKRNLFQMDHIFSLLLFFLTREVAQPSRSRPTSFVPSLSWSLWSLSIFSHFVFVEPSRSHPTSFVSSLSLSLWSLSISSHFVSVDLETILSPWMIQWQATSPIFMWFLSFSY
jgi:hypothetical protein